MSYFRKYEYRMIPDSSFTVVRNCPGCGNKSHYINTKRFRVNANGNKLDIWLIYQCGKCRHTLNLSVYERRNVKRIPQEEYRGFLDNDEMLAEEYGRNFSFFQRNHAEIESDAISFHFTDVSGECKKNEEMIHYQQGDLIVIENPYGLKIRPEKQAAEALGASRSQIKKMMENDRLLLKQKGKKLEIEIR